MLTKVAVAALLQSGNDVDDDNAENRNYNEKSTVYRYNDSLK